MSRIGKGGSVGRWSVLLGWLVVGRWRRGGWMWHKSVRVLLAEEGEMLEEERVA